MNIKSTFKKIIILDIILGIIIIVSSLFKPEEIMNLKLSLFPISDGLAIFYLVIMLIWLVNDFLLYNFKKIAKQIFLILFIISIIFSFFHGGGVYTSTLYLLDGLAWTFNGVILVFLYFTPIKKEFDK